LLTLQMPILSSPSPSYFFSHTGPGILHLLMGPIQVNIASAFVLFSQL
jgi:hypothetical protein